MRKILQPWHWFLFDRNTSLKILPCVFNTCNARVLNILEENNLDGYVSIVVEDPTTIKGKINFKNNQSKAKHIMFDLVKVNIMYVIILLNTRRECFVTLTNIFEKKDLNQEEGRIQRKVVFTKEEDILFIEIMKKCINPFTTKNFWHSKKKKFHKYLNKSNIWCYYCKSTGHYAREWYTKN